MKRCLTILLILSLYILAGCNSLTDENVKPEDQKRDEAVYPEEKEEEIYDEIIERDLYIDELMEKMTLQQKVGQVFMPAFRYDKNQLPILVLNDEIRFAIEEYHLGGIIFFSENIDTIDQTQKLIQDMQSMSNTPLFIAIDEEGGMVSRLNRGTNLPATRLPGNKKLGETREPELAYEVGKLLGRELSSLGVNMNFAPVADINTNPKNPVIGDRSFGDEPHIVGEMVAQMVRGLQEESVSAVVKHFPGHGDTLLDTHDGAVTVPHNIERLETIEFLPFKRGIDEEVDGVMLAHLQVPNITKGSLPATFSEEIVKDLLRQELKHDKLIITDALEMLAISKYWAPDEAAILAFKAGADILLMPQSLEKAYEGLLKAVEKEMISIERLDASVRRILMVKYERGILFKNENNLDPRKILGSQEHQKIVERILKERE
ncbi:beta-N-acetylhexosaminidase [Anaerovirgula multivorans]|uniref:beta-N-acetylhexosaminidase n=1 Tax=Anaerovirgula multivorans TaxID=312168 RepID=A0A239J0T5_9FIRM|nr:glycoside hydrolase family 3 protein [Anaerovirgula multivorans]SNS99375.1 beta-N-acetylhexosaminidase [Anaerovirgula multivorans]